MGEVNTQSSVSKHDRKRKKLSTRVDLTPMVDLGFLLITFFIFTTSMSEEKAIKLNLPPDTTSDKLSKTAEGKTISLVLGDNNTIWYYSGNDLASIRHTRSELEIRKLIIDKKKIVGAKYGDPKELVVLLKPTKESNYNNVVNMLDEMIINDVSRYVFMEPDETELAKLVNR